MLVLPAVASGLMVALGDAAGDLDLVTGRVTVSSTL